MQPFHQLRLFCSISFYDHDHNPPPRQYHESFFNSHRHYDHSQPSLIIIINHSLHFPLKSFPLNIMKYVAWKTRLKIFCQTTKSERSQLNFRVKVKVGQHVQILCSPATLHWSQTSNTEHSIRDQQHHFHLYNIRTQITWKHFSSSVVSTIRSRVKHNSRSSLSYHNDNDEGFYENVQGNEDEVREKLLSVLYIFQTPY